MCIMRQNIGGQTKSKATHPNSPFRRQGQSLWLLWQTVCVEELSHGTHQYCPLKRQAVRLRSVRRNPRKSKRNAGT